jgi:hypothetical protein
VVDVDWPHSSDWLDNDVATFAEGCTRNEVRPLDVLACMFSESSALAWARNPADVKRPAVAVGLIQFTRAWLGASADLDAFRALGVTGQLPSVERFFAPYRGKLTTPALIYCAMFLPAWLSKPLGPTTVLTAPSGPYGWAYAPNRSLDHGGKGYINLDDLRQAATNAARGARWDELSGRVLAAVKDAPTLPELPALREDNRDQPPGDGDGMTSETFPANDDGNEPPPDAA